MIIVTIITTTKIIIPFFIFVLSVFHDFGYNSFYEVSFF